MWKYIGHSKKYQCAMSLRTKYNVTVKDFLPSLLRLLVKDFQNEEGSTTISRTKENDT